MARPLEAPASESPDSLRIVQLFAAYPWVTAAESVRVEERLGQLEGAVERLRPLRKAEGELDSLRGRIGELQEAARAERRGADALKRTCEERRQRQQEADTLTRTRTVWETVAQLLGRSGIQTAPMRTALEDIQERANAMLSRLSGGQLQLVVSFRQIPRGEEIDFRCLDAASAEQPLDVRFLSGGQRFHCAVALAAAIGQHAGSAGRCHRRSPTKASGASTRRAGGRWSTRSGR